MEDLSNQSVSNRIMMPVHQGEYYVGITTDESVIKKDKEANFSIISIDFDGMPLGNKDAEVTLYKRKWNTVKKQNVDGDFYYENSFIDKKIESKQVTTDKEGKTQVSFTPKTGGNYKVQVVSKDSRGNKITASTYIFVTSSDFINWGRANNDRIEIVPDKLEYKVGETAHLLIKSPYKNVWGLITQERGSILDKKVMKINSNSEVIDIPITEKSIPNIFVSVVLIKGSDNIAGLTKPAKHEKDERNIASVKVGYATLHVDNSSKILNIKLSTDKTKYSPREGVIIKVKTTDKSGNPVSADVSLSVVDKSVLSLTKNITADLLNEFYRKRYLGVLTVNSLTQAIARMNVMAVAGLKGGGGGVLTKRGIFKDTAFWKASLKTDKNGYGEVRFTLPDNLTTWQVLGIGVTKDTLVGSQKINFLVTKDVLIRPVLPRFLINGDKARIGAIVHNYTDKSISFNVSLNAKGVSIDGFKETQITVPANAEKKVEFDITANNAEEAVFEFTAKDTSNSELGDRIEKKIPVKAFSFPEVVSTAFTMQDTDNSKHTETVWLPMGINQNFGSLVVSVAPSLVGTIKDSYKYLVDFPYACSEQTASALLSNIALKKLVALKLSNVDKKTQQQMTQTIESELQTIYKYQNPSGGWGLWQNSKVSSYTTAYVVYALTEAKKTGVKVDETVLNNGINYLNKYIKSHPLAYDKLNPKITKDYSTTSQFKQIVNERAFILLTLAQNDKADIAMTNLMFDYSKYMNIFAKADLIMTAKKIADESKDEKFKNGLMTKINTLKDDILKEAKESPRGIHFEEKHHLFYLFDSDIRTTAIVLQALTKLDPNHPYIPKILKYLLINRRDGHFESTQETSYYILALVDYLETSKELDASYNAEVTLNNKSVLNKKFSIGNIEDRETVKIPLTDLLPNNQNNELTFSKNGIGKLYGDITLKYYLPAEKIQSRNEGMIVTNEYFRLDDKKMEHPVTSAKVGETLKVKTTIVVPDKQYYVLLEDYLPAGLEGIDFSLETSKKSLNNQNENHYWDNPVNWYFSHSEVKDDRIMYFADVLPKGVYEIEYFVRASIKGTYHDLPALAQETYFPEVFGRSQGNIFTVN